MWRKNMAKEVRRAVAHDFYVNQGMNEQRHVMEYILSENR